MHLSKSTIAAFLSIISIANAYISNPEVGQPSCADIEDQGYVSLSQLDCASGSDALAACNSMCDAQSNGCQWGSKLSTNRRCSPILAKSCCSVLVRRTVQQHCLRQRCQQWLHGYKATVMSPIDEC